MVIQMFPFNESGMLLLCFKPILHYGFGLRFGKVCEQERKKNMRNVRKTKLARVFCIV